jgi:hypothetical protein
MDSLIHTSSGISDKLRRGLTPITDNAEALIELGFSRVYPQVRIGYESTIWERSIEVPTGPHTLRKLARQRAILERGERCEQ